MESPFDTLARILLIAKTERGCYNLIRFCKFPNHQFKCRLCGSENELVRLDPSTHLPIDPGQVTCTDCGHCCSLTVDTIFQGHHLPLTDLVPLVLTLVTDGGLSACQVARKTGLWYSTVWEWHKKARFYCSFFCSPDITQPVHFSHLLEMMCRRTIESVPGLAVDPELLNPDEVIPEPLDSAAVVETMKHIKVRHQFIGLNHAPGYTMQASFNIHFPEQVLKFFTACVRAGPKEIPRSDFLTLPLIGFALRS